MCLSWGRLFNTKINNTFSPEHRHTNTRVNAVSSTLEDIDIDMVLEKHRGKKKFMWGSQGYCDRYGSSSTKAKKCQTLSQMLHEYPTVLNENPISVVIRWPVPSLDLTQDFSRLLCYL